MSVAGLVERERELAELSGVLDAARAGEGAVVLVEAPAGQGKTALLRALRGQAADAGLRVLGAVGADLERDFPFGVVRQLLEPELHACPDERRERLFTGAARLAQPVFEAGDAPASAADASVSRLHGLYWLAANLADEGPAVLVVDDAHWADAPSMRFLDMLARRLEGLPLVLALGARPAEPGAQQEILDNLAAGPAARVLRPRPLTAAGVARLLADALGTEAEAPFAAAAAEMTAGSPLLVRELLRTLTEGGFTGRAEEVEPLRRALPSNVGRIVVGRLRRLAPDALALARGVAVLGERSRPADVAAVAEIGAEEAAAAHAVLARAGLLDPDELRFVHPIVREAVHADLVGGLRGAWHRRAARLRAEAGGDPAEVAAHLLQAEPAGEPWAAEALAAAGRRALVEGSPAAAVRHLRRALAEPPDSRARPAVLLELGQAEARTGEPGADEHLAEAAALGEGPLAARADRLRAQVLVLHNRLGESVEVLRRAHSAAAERDPAEAAEIEHDLIDVLAHHTPLRDEYLQRLEGAAGSGDPTLLAHLAFARAIGGAPAAEVLDLARRAFGGPGRDGEGRFLHFYALEALMLVEAVDDASAALRDATALAHRLGSRVVAGPLTYMPSSWAAFERQYGDLRQAEELARFALDLMLSARAPAMVEGLRWTLVGIHLDRGDHAAAREQVALLPAREAGPGLKETHGMRARLHLHDGRPADALADLEIELEMEARRGWVTSNREPSRLTLVRTLLALGRRDEARAAAEEQVAVAVRRQVAGAQARARLGLALTLDPGDEAIAALVAAADAARRSPSRLIQAEVVGELGAALRRAGDRTAAREHLAEARDQAHRCGAAGFEARWHEELVVAGARPRRVALSGVESLTAAERRVAELAAQGMRNREIAETLFVTLKTVEVHLGRTYGKLGIKARSQLAEALAPTP